MELLERPAMGDRFGLVLFFLNIAVIFTALGWTLWHADVDRIVHGVDWRGMTCNGSTVQYWPSLLRYASVGSVCLPRCPRASDNLLLCVCNPKLVQGLDAVSRSGLDLGWKKPYQIEYFRADPMVGFVLLGHRISIILLFP